MKQIIISHLCKSYGGEPVLSDFSAELPVGEVTVFMGRSGCGKTTLLRLLMGLEKPDSGTVSGVPKAMSAVFQEDRLFEAFHAVANLKGALGKDADEQAIREHLSQLELTGEALKKPVLELSGGMRRRVALARAVLAESGILFLDEPFDGLDGVTNKKAAEYVKRHREGRTVLLVTHDRAEAESLGGTIIFMDKEGENHGREN